MNPPKIGDMVSVWVILKEHIRKVSNRTPTLEAAAKVLEISLSKLFRFRWKFKLGQPDRTPPQDDAENWTDD